MNEIQTNYNKKYISNNISLIDNHIKIIEYVFFKNIIYSENNNGYLINISKLSDQIIDELYQIIFNIIENYIDFDYKEKEEIKGYMNICNKTNEKELSSNDIELSLFSNEAKKIIKLSKNYKFE